MVQSMFARDLIGILVLSVFLAGCGANFEEIRSAPTVAAAIARAWPQPAEPAPPPAPEPSTERTSELTPEYRTIPPAEPPTVLSRVWSKATGRQAALRVTGQLFVRFTPEAAAAVEQARRSTGRPHVGIESLDRLLDTYGVVRIEPVFSPQPDSAGIYLLDLTTAPDRASLIQAFNDDPAIVYAEPKYLPEQPISH